MESIHHFHITIGWNKAKANNQIGNKFFTDTQDSVTPGRSCRPRRVACGIQIPIFLRFGKPAAHNSQLPSMPVDMADAIPVQQGFPLGGFLEQVSHKGRTGTVRSTFLPCPGRSGLPGLKAARWGRFRNIRIQLVDRLGSRFCLGWVRHHFPESGQLGIPLL